MSNIEEQYDNKKTEAKGTILGLFLAAIIFILIGVSVFTHNIPIIQGVAIFAIILSIAILVYWFKEMVRVSKDEQ